ncbi:M56 family metallopeptidase [Ferruginibacter sp.]
MNYLLEYILKCSVSLAAVYLFYYCILRKLTFYNHNRWYLLGYSLLCFFIPLINVSVLLQKNNWQQNNVINWMPSIDRNTINELPAATTNAWGIKEWITMVVSVGMLIMFVRLLIQVLSFKRMLDKAEPVTGEGINLYQVNDSIIPFSFGNAIFINRHLHSESELQEIIRHEFVHVKQRHSFDIIWAELLCIFNWYNPFVWLLKKAIRQNLEFIADHQVLEQGINKKEYQYLLLKVIGNNQYSIATQFNFYSLKKRIAMMNKTKSAKRQLARLLFLLPATAVLLLAFRNKWNAGSTATASNKTVSVAGMVVDAKTLQPLANAGIYCKEKNITVQTDEKGYYLLQLPFENKPLQFTLQVTKEGYEPFHQTENWGNFYQSYIYDRYSKSVEYFGLAKPEGKAFSSLGNAGDMNGLTYDNVAARLKEVLNSNSAYYDGTVERDTVIEVNSKGYNLTVRNNNVIVRNSSGKEVKRIPLKDWNNNTEKYENAYGELPAPPPPPPPPPAPVPPATPGVPAPAAPPVPAIDGIPAPPSIVEVPTPAAPSPVPPPAAPAPPKPLKLPANVKRLDVNNNKATVWLKNGQQEKYDLDVKEQKENFEKKYGKLPEVPDAPGMPKIAQ